MKPSSSLKITYPTAFHFKEERVLAAHPPSCHPRRVFGCPESERKGEKARKNGKERKAESFSPILLLSQNLSLITVQELIYCPIQEKLQKEPKSKVITRDKCDAPNPEGLLTTRQPEEYS